MSATINQTLAQKPGCSCVITRLDRASFWRLAVTLSLFWLMQYLIETADRTLE